MSTVMTTKREEWFVVEQGIYSPRDKVYSFRFWGYANNVEDARRLARNLPVMRIVYCKLVEENVPNDLYAPGSRSEDKGSA